MDEMNQTNDRRNFLKQSVLGAVAVALPAASAHAASDMASTVPAQTVPAGYVFMRPDEAAFVEALVDHMAPADAFSPKGTDMGLAVFFDRALASAWGQGDRLYLHGPFSKGTRNQGYQLPLTPAQLFRSGSEALRDYCQATFQKPFAALSAESKEQVLLGLRAGSITLANGLPSSDYFAQLYQLFVEGMFADPIYGGNQNKAGWRMIGFTGVIQTNRRNIVQFKNKPFHPVILSIADLS